jgi:iron complex outermembrane receptor protein
MKNIELKKFLLGTSLIVGVAAAQPAFAQDVPSDDEFATQTVPAPVAEEDDNDEVVVTGSRIKQDTFSSIAPLQVINFDEQRDLGLVDAVEILQTSEAAAGVQIDSAFSGFVLDNGPGSETIDLRGLGASRTLVLINGRRMAPAGVEGAPSQPSINLLPSSLIEDVDQLLDGASSIYGSDAVAGVINVVLRRDFEGLEVNGAYDLSEQPNGNDYNINASYGKNFDRGFIGFGGEFDHRDALKLRDRDFLQDCETNQEIDENGRVRSIDIDDQTTFDSIYGDITAADANNPCVFTGFSSRIFVTGGGNGPGSIYFVEGQSNTGIPNFVDQTLLGVPLDVDGDGVQDFGFQQFNTNGGEDFNNTDLVAEQDRVSLMAFGEYTLEGDANITPFFEALYTKVDTNAESGAPQLFPTVSAVNPFNPCGTNGVDCRGAQAAILGDPDLNRRFAQNFGGLCAQFGFSFEQCTPELFGVGFNFGPRDVVPIFSIDGDRDNFDVSIEQTRLVGGFKGDLPFMNFGEFSDWTFEASLAHSFSSGVSERTGVRDDRLNFALGNDLESGVPNGAAPCVALPGQAVSPDVSQGCVPVNAFAPSVLGTVVGNFATQAERDYLFDSRDFDTRIKQTVWSAFATGKVAEVPAGNINLVLGLEYRTDEIESIANAVASEGLLFGFFTDGGTNGKRFTREAYAEVSLPLVADKPFFRQLDVNLSGRVLEDEFYGGAAVYSAKAGWRPFDSLLLRAGYGTSYRSPNLRENFLGPQSGFVNVFDPCVVPAEAFVTNPATGEGIYLANEDARDPNILERCRAEGLDPTTLGGGVNAIRNIEQFRVGSLDLDAEESTSLTLGASFEQPITEAFDLSLGVGYYNISVDDEVVEATGQFSINDCFVFENDTRSRFCDTITRDEDGLIDSIDATFLNRDNRKVRGLDFNARYSQDITAFDRPFELDIAARANHIIEVSDRFVNDNGTVAEDNDEGEFGFSDWTASGSARVTYKDFGVSWGFRYVSSAEQDEDFIDDFGNVLQDAPGGAFSSTCGGPSIGDLNCRDVGFADDYMLHNAGISYNNEDEGWTAGIAVRNVFDKEPPRVDGSEVTSVSNAPIGAGYDFYGRSFVFRLGKEF